MHNLQFMTIACRAGNVLGAILSVAMLLPSSVLAQDEVVDQKGVITKGLIEKYDRKEDKLVFREEGQSSGIAFPRSIYKKFTLSPRPEFKQASKLIDEGKPEEAIKLLQPLYDNYLGLEVPWVVEAAGSLAEALSDAGKRLESQKIYDELTNVYPESSFRYKGKLAEASRLIEKNLPKDAFAILDEVEKALPKAVLLPPADMRIYSELHFIRGEAYEKTSKPAEALTEYIKVYTLFYKPAARATEAEKRVEAIRKANPRIIAR